MKRFLLFLSIIFSVCCFGVNSNTDSLSKAFKKANDSRKIKIYNQIASNYNSSVAPIESSNSVGSLEKEIELLNKKQEINSLKIQQQYFSRNLLIIIILLTFTLAILFYFRYKSFRKTNKILKSQNLQISKVNKGLVALNKSLTLQKNKFEALNAELQIANSLLSESKKNLQELNATKDKFFSLISHDLRNPFASIISFSRMMKRDINKFTKKEIKELSLELDKSVSRINDILENLLWWSRLQTGRIIFNPENILLNELIKEELEELNNIASDKGISITNNIDPDSIVFADNNIATIILRNLIGNAIKFSNSGTTIWLKSVIENNFVKISVIDQGVGIKPENIEKLFHIENGFTTYGTNDEKGSGLGLILCKNLVELHGGKIAIQSTPDKGTTVSFTLPLSK